MPVRNFKSPKVFGIGFHKTATTSLAHALKMLGYHVTGPNGAENSQIAKEAWPMSLKLASEFDAFQDNPWPILYQKLDEEFPGSKFVLTQRPTDEWLKSIVRHFRHATTPMREWIYGVGHPAGNENIYVARFEKHNRDVLEYFKNRPQDLLVMNITKGDGWEKLCPFLGAPVPDNPFPQSNIAVQLESQMNLVSRILRAIRRKIKAL